MLSFFFTFSNSNAQYNEYDIDSIQYIKYTPNDSINGLTEMIASMEYLSDQTRKVYRDSIKEGFRYVVSEAYEEIDSEGRVIHSERNDFYSQFEMDYLYNAIYENGILKQRDYSYYSDQPWNFGENKNRSIFEFHDEFGLPTQIREFQNLNGSQNLELVATIIIENHYSDGLLDSIIKFKLNESFGGLEPSESTYYSYDSSGLLTAFERYYYSFDGTERNFAGKWEYFYLNNGNMDYTLFYNSIYQTEDPTDSQLVLKKEYLYDANDKLTKELFYRYNNDQDYYLDRSVNYFRSNISSIFNPTAVISSISINCTINNRILQINITDLEKTDRYNIQLINLQGNPIDKIKVENEKYWNQSYTLIPGIYLLNIKSNSGVNESRKIIIW